MIGALTSGILSLVSSLVSLILSPIDNLIALYLPDASSALLYIQQFFSLCVSSVGWVIDCLGIPAFAVNLIILFFTFKLSIFLLVYPVKLVLKWYNYLKT